MSPSRRSEQVREDGPDRADDAVDVRREQAVERLGVALPQVAADVHACVRDQDVDAAVGSIVPSISRVTSSARVTSATTPVQPSPSAAAASSTRSRERAAITTAAPRASNS